MFTIVSSVTSPCGRIVRFVVDCLGLSDQMRLQHADTMDSKDPLLQINPLGKIPAQVPDGGEPIFDSRVIVDYLETTYGDVQIIPRNPVNRIRELTLAALAEGINDALPTKAVTGMRNTLVRAGWNINRVSCSAVCP